MFDKKVWEYCLFEILLLCLFVSIVSAYSGGTGTSIDPYQIANVADLLTLAGTAANYNKYFILTADIDMAGQTFTKAIIAPDTNSSLSGFQGTAFTGTFDGNGHNITHFTINGGLYNSYIGLFGYINGGSVKNLGIENFSVNGASYIGGLVGYNGSGSLTNCYSTGSVSGDSYIGGLVGYNINGNISSCYSACSACCNNQYAGGLVGYNGGSITNSYSTGNVCGYYYIGGLVGYNTYSITNCYSTGTVLGSGYLGGLVGRNERGISKCYSTGTVIGYDQYLGGLVGYNYNSSSSLAYAAITNCYATGEVDGSWSSYMGGLVGYNYSANSTSWPYTTPVLISYCYSTGAVTGIGCSAVGGLAGYSNSICVSSFWDIYTSGRSSSSGGIGITTAEMKLLSTFASAGWNFITVWDIDDGQTYPYLFKKTNYSGGNGTPPAPYQIANVEDLLTLANTVTDYNKCFIQTTDINMAGRASPIAIIAASTSTDSFFEGTVFSGTFDGNDHEITHFTINGGSNNSYLGLFGRIDGGSVKNLGIENFSVSGGYQYIGGLVGRSLHGNITNCYSTGTVSGSSNSQYVGGLVGSNSTGNSITNCYSTGAVSGSSNSQYIGGLVGVNNYGSISDCYSISVVSGSLQVGDLAGYNSGTINDCFSTGAVSGSSNLGGLVGYNYSGSITNCYSAGAVSGTSLLGGLVGYNNSSGSISICYSTGTVLGSIYSGGLAGRNYGSISSCYSAGAVSGDSNSQHVGGLVGDNNSVYGIIIASFWDVNTSGGSASSGGEGKTTAEMKTESTFTSAGWDFSYTDGNDAVWYMAVEGYPILTWQISPADIYTDGKNNFMDFAVFARYWMRDDCRRYNSYCEWADLNFDGSVDIDDLIIFMNYWLQLGIYE